MLHRGPRFARWQLWLVLAATGASLLAQPVQAAARPNPCRFVLGFATLQGMAPAAIGQCTNDQAFAPNGDAVQNTTKGLLVWRKADNWTAFTNGYQTWINGPTGLVTRFNDEWFEWEAYPAFTDGVPVNEAPPTPPSPTEVSLGSLIHTDQTLDNCGPAAIAEVLRYYGIMKSQQQLQTILRPNDPTGMTPARVPGFAQSVGMRSLIASGGTDRLVKALVRAHLPVIVEQVVSSSDGQLHYRPIEGYDEARQRFIAADPLLGPRHGIPYSDFGRLWASTNHLFMVIYPPSKQQALNGALAAAGWR